MHIETYILPLEGMYPVLLASPLQSLGSRACWWAENNAQVTMCLDGNNYTVKLTANEKLLTPYA